MKMGRMDAELNRIPMTWSGAGVCREEEEGKGKAGEGRGQQAAVVEKKKSANFCECLLSTCVWA